ncbi:MAG: hypothetical protein K8F24_10040 [Bacteroidales bacterium]|nr:hypothetical protein [Bacteroidales bacterium]
MKINHKQQELIELLLTSTKTQFPEIEYKGMSKNPDDKEHLFINITAAFDDSREEYFRDFTAEMEADIHLDTGYRISFMLDNPNLLLEQAAY